MNRKDRKIISDAQCSIEEARNKIEDMQGDCIYNDELVNAIDALISSGMDSLRELSDELEDRSNNVANLTQQDELSDQAANIGEVADSLEEAKERLGELIGKTGEFDEVVEELLDDVIANLDDADATLGEYA